METLLEGRAIGDLIAKRVASAALGDGAVTRQSARLGEDPASGCVWRLLAAAGVALAAREFTPPGWIRMAGYGAAVTLAVRGAATMLGVDRETEDVQ